jgi:hypothetical protein
MPLRPCLGTPDQTCSRLTDRTDSRCPACAAARERARGTRQQRGLGSDYDRAREQALTGATHCATCGQAFTLDNPATGGHVKARRHGGTTADGIKPECRRCNYGWEKSGS